MELVRRLLVGLLGMIDAVVYDIISMIYDLLMDIARATPFDNKIFTTLSERVYALLGLFMLFKVSFSLIKYIVNPDEFNDKVKGGKKLVVNILIVLLLIVVTPIGFRISRDVQQTLLDEHVMENIILGAGVNGQEIKQDEMGDITKKAVFSAFYRPDDEACANAIFDGSTSAVDTCSSVMGSSAAQLYINAYNAGSIFNMIHEEDPSQGEPLFMIKKPNNEKEYAINYMFLVSTVAGVVTALLFLNFCFDIAVRTVKLGFLEMISPIPIISYIDPSSAKNGMFSKWLKEVGKTYFDLFIRLGAVYFAITLIAMLMQNTNLGTTNLFARVFIILGILIFAKQVPQLIGDLFGIKIDGNFSLNPMSKITSAPLASAAVGGIAGFVGGGVANAAAKFMNAERDAQGNIINKGQTARQMVTSGLGGAFGGMIGAGAAGLGGKTSPFKNAASTIQKNSAIRNYNERYGGALAGATTRGIDKLTSMAGIKYSSGSTSEIKSAIQMKQRELANAQLQEKALEEARLNIVNNQGAATGGLLKTFDYKVGEFDAKGRVKSYEQKSYSDYAMRELQHIVESSGADWNSMDTAARQSALAHQVSVTQKIVSEDIFNQINDLYVEKGKQDILEAKIQKEITELEESRDLGKNLGGKK